MLYGGRCWKKTTNLSTLSGRVEGNQRDYVCLLVSPFGRCALTSRKIIYIRFVWFLSFHSFSKVTRFLLDLFVCVAFKFSQIVSRELDLNESRHSPFLFVAFFVFNLTSVVSRSWPNRLTTCNVPAFTSVAQSVTRITLNARKLISERRFD